MATTTQETPRPTNLSPKDSNFEHHLSTYIGLTFTIFISTLPKKSQLLASQNNTLLAKIQELENKLKQLHVRRKEDSKANARVVEIFATHRHCWQQEEKRLLQQIDELRGRNEELEGEVQDLKREVQEREEMLDFMSKGVEDGEECFLDRGFGNVDEIEGGFGQNNVFSAEFADLGSEFWAEKASLWQGAQYDSVDSVYDLKHYVTRRESPWKVDGDSSGVSSKLQLLEQELLNLERIGTGDLSKVPSLMRKQAKRYQALAGKIDDLCRRMQVSDPCEPKLSPEFRTQRQTDFLLEAFRLQQRASETGQKLMALQNDTGKGFFGDDLEGQAKLMTRRSLNSIKNNFRDIQRNLEIWLARIIGDVEGILSRDGASRLKEYYMSRYPYVQ